jgi:hypothetical protein
LPPERFLLGLLESNAWSAVCINTSELNFDNSTIPAIALHCPSN